MLNYLKSLELLRRAIFAFDFNVVNKTDGLLNALNSTTALTSSSFVN